MQDEFDGGVSDQENRGNLSLNQAFAPFYLLISLSIIMLGITIVAGLFAYLYFHSKESYESDTNLGASINRAVWEDSLTPSISTVAFLMISKLLVNWG
ncbi:MULTISPECIES: hypothetical protein [unclassified Aerococcus]|uniref:hypothetical protein n=1 Tax=unclassified Aerococcus TaxID=2618060 RepID=UPI00114CD309|nr:MULTISPECIES: hypothetical protein [unclassified Aerococcus]MDK6855746.1 hypothetical protein [Aerococcus sp. UMB7533]